MAHLNESRHIGEPKVRTQSAISRIKSWHICMSHGISDKVTSLKGYQHAMSCMNESWHIWKSHCTCKYVMSHTGYHYVMSYGWVLTHIDESWHIWMSHVAQEVPMQSGSKATTILSSTRFQRLLLLLPHPPLILEYGKGENGASSTSTLPAAFMCVCHTFHVWIHSMRAPRYRYRPEACMYVCHTFQLPFNAETARFPPNHTGVAVKKICLCG